MDIKEIRVANLNFLLKQFRGSREEFALACGYDGVNYLNQLLTGAGSFGSRTAKKISTNLGKDEGWLDRIHTQSVAEDSPQYHEPKPATTEVVILSERDRELLAKTKNLSDEALSTLLTVAAGLAASEKSKKTSE